MRVKRIRFIIFLLFPAIWAISGSNSWSSVFEVRGVPVDVTAQNAAQARNEALALGQHKAFRRLLERLTLLKDSKKLPEVETLDITEFVSDFAVSDEKTSSVRYLAKLNVRFKSEPVRSLLRNLGLRFAETRSKPLLILPVLNVNQVNLLWEDENNWRRAWNSKVNRHGLVKIILPVGDEMDMSTLSIQKAINGSTDYLSRLAERYGAGDTLVSYLRVGRALKTGKRRLQISNIRYSSLHEPTKDFFTLAFKPAEGERAAMARGAEVVIEKLEEEWKFKNLLSHNGQGVGTFTVPISSLKDWLNVKERIMGVSLVRRLELVLVSLDEVRINLHYAGDHGQLGIALRQADLTMIKEGDEWVLYSVDVMAPDKS